MTAIASEPPAAEFSRPVAVSRLGAAEKTFTITADAAERTALTRRFGILSVDRLDATLRLKTFAGGTQVRLRGHLEAVVTQACVVTLEPVRAELAEDFTLVFAEPEDEGEGGEIDLDLDGEDPPEPILEGMIDMGEAVAEHLALALDPFPRAPGAEFAPPPEERNGEERGEQAGENPAGKANPFAALAALRKK